FAGRPTEGASGLLLMGARHYDPTTGTFLQVDPLVLETSQAYAYAVQNPYRFWDPTGLRSGGINPSSSWYPSVANSSSSSYASSPLPSPSYGSKSPGNAGSFGGFLDSVQIGLDVASIGLDSTGVGGAVSFIPDLLNAGISLGRGDYVGAGMSSLAAVPFVGIAANAARVARSADTFVYVGIRDGAPVYTGVTNNLAWRPAEHADRFSMRAIAPQPVTRSQAREIEQAQILRNPGFENLRNSISPRRADYDAAVERGESWLRANFD
ncbi:MAG: RHS repeat-associated core domain-containing protein, partial [Myxococcota bacterium]